MANKTVTVKSADGDYSSLNAALAGENADLVTNTCILTIECYNFQDTTAATTGTGYTTSDDYYINIVSMDDHVGVRSSSAYRLETTTVWDATLYILEDYTRVQGLQVKNASASGSQAIYVTGSNCPVIDTIVYDCGLDGFYLYGSIDILNNCIAMSCGGTGIFAANTSKDYYIYNCCAVNCANGFSVNAWSTIYAKNCYAGGSSGTDYAKAVNGAYVFTTSYSEDGSESTPTAAFSTSSGCYFTNVTAGAENLDIGASSGLINVGTDLGADGYWIHPDGEVDIVGRTRGNNAWDVGAFEYVAAGGLSWSGAGTLTQSGAINRQFAITRGQSGAI